MDNLKMLPEYLFTVGHSMQDISREDFLISNGGDVSESSLEKDMCPTVICRIQNNSSLNNCAIGLPKPFSTEDNSTHNNVDVKLEDINPVDLFPSQATTWQQNSLSGMHELNNHPMFSHKCYERKSAKLLLQGSDDPLISHGANNVLINDDEHPADFAKSLIVQHEVHHQKPQCRPVKSGCSNLTRQQLKVKANLMSAKNQQKQNQSNAALASGVTASNVSVIQKHSDALKSKKKKTNALKLRFHHQALPPEYLSHYEATQSQQGSSKSQQQRTSCKSVNSSQKQTQPRNSNENVRSWLQKIAEIQRTANASKEKLEQNQKTKPNFITNETKVIANNQTRKENNTENQGQYTTDLPPKMLSTNPTTTHDDFNCISKDNNNNESVYRRRTVYNDLPYMGEITLENCKPRRGRKPKKADICHLIYKNYGTIMPKKSRIEHILPGANIENHQQHMSLIDCEQPLNLCLRDQLLNDSYSISSGEELSETNSSCPTPVNTVYDCNRDAMLANSLKNSLNTSNISDVTPRPDDRLSEPSGSRVPLEKDNNLMQPLNTYYQKILDSGMLLNNSNYPFKTIRKDNQLALKIPIPKDFLFSQKLQKTLSNQISNSKDYHESCTNQQAQPLAAQKKKRSAIFIPPMNIENTTNSATEVSICKFKFTGGSKPMLQEKKMVSVDAGGNYRYFSGTGDKASRGFEYFPRESLQHTAGLLPGVNCTVEKLPFSAASLTDLNTEFLEINEPTMPSNVSSESHH